MKTAYQCKIGRSNHFWFNNLQTPPEPPSNPDSNSFEPCRKTKIGLQTSCISRKVNRGQHNTSLHPQKPSCGGGQGTLSSRSPSSPARRATGLRTRTYTAATAERAAPACPSGRCTCPGGWPTVPPTFFLGDKNYYPNTEGLFNQGVQCPQCPVGGGALCCTDELQQMASSLSKAPL